ncbi:MAG: FAD-dependent oxidoreductase [Candidatus Moranbacteria bacterium]|jgi:alkyl hydroperoxide reductase subunit F|nr:FAD-dependent oxidoreductase [Candidatus Moranbacteria bacterium]MBP9801901.1 FAD-dependent oxidoreductase [Candidatus Moranbacteria bacterium]
MVYDIVVIGGGPGGVSSAIYASRKQLKTLMITESIGGQSSVSASVENWIGTISIPGWDLAQSLEEHLRAQEGIEIRTGELVVGVEENEGQFLVKGNSGETYQAKTIIIASGGRHRSLDVPGEEKFRGKGVVYCSTCDAPFFRGKKVVVVGGGNSGLEAVEDLLPYASEIVLMVRSGELKGDAITREKILADSRVSVVYFGLTQEILGEEVVTGLRYKDAQTGEEKSIESEGVFVEIGMIPNSDFVAGLIDRNERGEIVLDHRTKATSRVGIFATGDVTDAPYKQNNISAGDGVVAALSAYDYLRKQG